MSRCLFAIFSGVLLCSIQAHAQVPVSFERAVAAFEAGEHDSARTAFDRMARAGFTEAQFNLGAMLLNGQGGEASLVEGAAWIQLAAAEGYEPAIETSEVLRGQFEADRLAEIDGKAAELRAEYGRQSLLDRHRPRLAEVSENDEPAFESSSERRFGQSFNRIVTTIEGSRVQLEMNQPRYPRSAADNGIMGFVQMAAWLEPSGEVRHAHVVFAYPEGVFDREALRAYSRIRAEWLEEPPEQAVYLPRSIAFTLDGLSSGPILRELERGLEAHEDDLAAQYRLIWLSEKLSLNDVEPFDPDTVIEVSHQAAMAGVVDAQLDLARRFRGGGMLARDVDSSNFWLKQAAFEGNAQAAFELSRCDLLDDGLRRDLRQAAIEQGHLSALLLAIRELTENPEQASAEEMAALLERLPPEFSRNSRDPVLNQAREIAAG